MSKEAIREQLDLISPIAERLEELAESLDDQTRHDLQMLVRSLRSITVAGKSIARLSQLRAKAKAHSA